MTIWELVFWVFAGSITGVALFFVLLFVVFVLAKVITYAVCLSKRNFELDCKNTNLGDGKNGN